MTTNASTLTASLKNTSLFLVGMMGAGKTTVGQQLAQQLGYQFFDTDAVIEQVAKKSIAEIFAVEGESYFRDLETQVLSELSAYGRLTIATGGGIVLKRQNWSYLHHGIVVWLDVSPEDLYQRLQQDRDRPLLQTPDPEQRIRELLEQRRPLYAQADVHVKIAATDTVEAIVNTLIRQVQESLKLDESISSDLESNGHC